MNLHSLLANIKTRRKSGRKSRRDSSAGVSQLESLEQKTLLAGNVTAQLIGQTAVVTGDSAANSVEIVTDGGNVVARGLDGTTINGSTNDFVLAAGDTLAGNLIASLGRGSDTFVVNGVSVGGSAIARGGRGGDMLIFSAATVGHNLTVIGGAGADDIVIDDSRVGQDTRIAGRAGDDDIIVRNSELVDDLSIKGNRGNDIILFDSSSVGDHSWISGGAGRDNVQIQGTSVFADRLKTFGGPGRDNLETSSEVIFDGLRRFSYSGSTVDAGLFDARITDPTTGALGQAEALLGQNGDTSVGTDLTLTVDNPTVTESAGDGAATLTIIRTGTTTSDQVVTLTSSDPSVLEVGSSTVTIPAGETSGTVFLNPQNNSVTGTDSVVTVTASADGAADTTIDITVANDDFETLSLSASVSQIFEDTGSATTTGSPNTLTLTATRSGDTSSDQIVNLAASVADQFALPETITIPAGQSSFSFDVQTIGDTNVESDESVILTATTVGFTTGTATVVVQDNDANRLDLEFSAPTIEESGNDLLAGLTVTRNTATTNDLTVTLTSEDVESLTFDSGATREVVIPAGQSSVTVTVSGVPESIDDGDIQVSVSATADGFTTGSDSIVALDDDNPTLTISVPGTQEFSEDAGAGAISATVTRNSFNTASDLVVNLSTSGDSRISGPTSVTIPAGSQSATVSFDTVDNNIVDSPPNGTATLTASATDFDSGSTTVTIINDDDSSISLSPASFSVAENSGTGGASITVSRTDTSIAETIALTYSDSSLLTGPASVTFAVGEETQNVAMDVIDNDLFSPNSSVLVTATGAGHADVFTTIGIINDDTLTLTMDTSANATTESVGAQLTRNTAYTISGVTAPGATVQLDSNGDAAFDEDSTIADANGNYSFNLTLTNDVANRGLNRLQVRSVIISESVDTRSDIVDVHLAVGTVVRFQTNQDLDNDGTNDFYDVELLDTAAEITVNNFLAYVNGGNYENMFVHRSPFNFVIQGGGFTVNNGSVSNVTTNPTITNEFNSSNSNVRGTLSMALVGGQPNSGTGQWFVNVRDNTALDGDLHTVFGRVIGQGMNVVDAINQLPIFDLNLALNQGALAETPLTSSPFLNLAGSISLTSNSSTVTGTGTSFTSDLQAGDFVRIGGAQLGVLSVVSDTEITVDITAASDQTGLTISKFNPPQDEDFIVFSNIGEILDSI